MSLVLAQLDLRAVSYFLVQSSQGFHSSPALSSTPHLSYCLPHLANTYLFNSSTPPPPLLTHPPLLSCTSPPLVLSFAPP
ncbi:hypothetical protein FKM82_019118 [Ascaphus truei]